MAICSKRMRAGDGKQEINLEWPKGELRLSDLDILLMLLSSFFQIYRFSWFTQSQRSGGERGWNAAYDSFAVVEQFSHIIVINLCAWFLAHAQ